MFLKFISKLKNNHGEVRLSTDPAMKIEQVDKKQGSDADEKLPEYMSDLNLDGLKDLTPEARKSVIELLKTKGKDLYTGVQKKTEALAKERKALEDRQKRLKDVEAIYDRVSANPKLEKAVLKVIDDMESGRVTENKTDQNLKRLDRLISNAQDAQTREELQQLREIIHEEVQSKAVSSKELEEFREEMDAMKRVQSHHVTIGVKGAISRLSEQYGKERIEECRAGLEKAFARHPDYIGDDNREFQVLALHLSREDLVEALIESRNKKVKQENLRKANGTFPHGDSNPKPVEKPRLKGGRVDVGKWLNNLKAAGRF